MTHALAQHRTVRLDAIGGHIGDEDDSRRCHSHAQCAVDLLVARVVHAADRSAHGVVDASHPLQAAHALLCLPVPILDRVSAASVSAPGGHGEQQFEPSTDHVNIAAVLRDRQARRVRKLAKHVSSCSRIITERCHTAYPLHFGYVNRVVQWQYVCGLLKVREAPRQCEPMARAHFGERAWQQETRHDTDTGTDEKEN
jgi:hypothetical protein